MQVLNCLVHENTTSEMKNKYTSYCDLKEGINISFDHIYTRIYLYD